MTYLRGGVAMVLALMVLSACSNVPPASPLATPVAQNPSEGEGEHMLTSPIDRLDAYLMCRALLTSRIAIDRDLALSTQKFAASRITEFSGTFEVEILGPTPAGGGSVFCVLTGTLGDPVLLYNRIGAKGEGEKEWHSIRQTALISYPARAVDAEREDDRSERIGEIVAWSVCRVLRLASQPTDFIAGWSNFDTAELSRGTEGIEIHEVFPSGTVDADPVETSSFCLIDGTMDEPFPVFYLERPADSPPDARDVYYFNYAETVRGQLED